MKNVFYGLASFILFSILISIMITEAPQLNVNEYDGCVVIGKRTTLIFGSDINVISKSDSIMLINVFDYVYEKYEVGDTIRYEDRWHNVN